MNDLMTKSFLSYVELKKQDIESEPDLEIGPAPDSSEGQNLSLFLEEVNKIKTEVEEITNLLIDLQHLNEESKSTHSTKVLRGIRDKINCDMVSIIRKAKTIKSRLNRGLSKAYKEGSSTDRTRVSVTNGLRVKLREMMQDFQALRENILKDHKEGLKRRYYNATGEELSEEIIEKMILGDGQERVFDGKEDLVMENQERNEALKEIQRSLADLHQVFLDMAILVETQGDEINNTEEKFGGAGINISGGTNGLQYANRKKKKRRNWACWVGVFLLIALVVLVVILGS